MKHDITIENAIRRHRVIHSAFPIEALDAKLYFHGLIRQIEQTGRSYDIHCRGRLVAHLQNALKDQGNNA